jgi:hypothetical protein
MPERPAAAGDTLSRFRHSPKCRRPDEVVAITPRVGGVRV